MALLPKSERRKNPVALAWNEAVPGHRWSQNAAATIRPLISSHGEDRVADILAWYKGAKASGEPVPDIRFPANLVAKWDDLLRARKETSPNEEVDSIVADILELGWAVGTTALKKGVSATLTNYRGYLLALTNLRTSFYGCFADYLLAHSPSPHQLTAAWYVELNRYFAGEAWCPYMNRWHLHHFKVTKDNTLLAQQFLGSGAAWEKLRLAVQREGENL